MTANSVRIAPLGELVNLHTEQTNPGAHPNVAFEHYSIPAYDAGPEAAIEMGADIKSNKFTLPEGAILLSKLNPRINRVWTPEASGTGPAVTSTEFLVLTPRPGVNRRFLHYLLRSPAFRADLSSRVTGTSGSHQRVRPLDVLAIPIAVPPLETQQSISNVLGCLDDKIEFNRRMGEALDRLATELVKAWFVDYVPTRTKQAGTSLGLPQEIDTLFPSSLLTTEDGEVPDAWRVARFSELLTERSERVGDRPVPAYSSTNAGLVLREERFKKQLSSTPANNKLIVKGDLVFGLSRQVLNFGVMFGDAGSVSPAYRVYRVDSSQIEPSILERIMRLRPMHFYRLVSSSSREGQSISPAAIETLPVTVPPLELQRKFLQLMRPIEQRRDLCLQEICVLEALRDSLLPKLLSGELRVPEAEQFVGEVA